MKTDNAMVKKILDLECLSNGRRTSSVIDTSGWGRLLIQVHMMDGPGGAVLILGASDEVDDDGRLVGPGIESPIMTAADIGATPKTIEWHVEHPRKRYYQLEVIRPWIGAELASAVLYDRRPEK